MNLYCGACKTTIPETEFTGACPGCGNGAMQIMSEGKISYAPKSTLRVCAICGGLFATDPNEGFAGTPCTCSTPAQVLLTKEPCDVETARSLCVMDIVQPPDGIELATDSFTQYVGTKLSELVAIVREEAQRDKARLDWLAANAVFAGSDTPTLELVVPAKLGHSGDLPTFVRAAIDATAQTRKELQHDPTHHQPVEEAAPWAAGVHAAEPGAVC